MINEFIVEAVDLGDLEKIRIGHDNAGKLRDAAKKEKKLSDNFITLLLSQGVLQVGFWTGLRLTPPPKARDCGSHVAVGWIKERMMGRL